MLFDPPFRLPRLARTPTIQKSSEPCTEGLSLAVSREYFLRRTRHHFEQQRKRRVVEHPEYLPAKSRRRLEFLQDDHEFSRAVKHIVQGITDAISLLLADIPNDEHRMTLAAAIVGMAESVTRQKLWARNTDLDPDELAGWVSELAWFGMRGLRLESDLS